MDRSKGMSAPMQLSNQDSIYPRVCLSTCYGCIVGHIQYAPIRIHDHFSQKDEIPTKAARFAFCFSIFDHAYRRDMRTVYACYTFTSFNL